MKNEKSLFQAAFEANPLGIVIVNVTDKKALKYNKAFAAICRISEGTNLKKDNGSIFYHFKVLLKDPTKFSFIITEPYNKNVNQPDETLLLKDGRTIKIKSEPLGVGGLIKYRAWYFQDVSDFNQPHENFYHEKNLLVERELFFKDILDSIPILIAHVGLDGRYEFVNKPYLKWFRKTEQEILGKTVREVLGETLYKTVKPLAEKALQGHTSEFNREGNFPCGRKFVHGSYIPTWNDDGTNRGFKIVNSDISRIKELELEARTKGEQLQSLLDNLSDAIHLQDASGKVLQTNRGFLRILGVDLDNLPKESIRAGAMKIVSEDMTPLRKDELPSVVALTTGKTHKRTIGVYKKDGLIVWFAVTAVPLMPDAQGKFQQVLITSRDISELRRSELALDLVNERRLLSFSALQYGTWDLYLKDNRLVWDDFMYTLYGLKKEEFEISRDTFGTLLDPKIQKKFENTMAKTIENRDSEFRMSFEVMTPKGSRHIASCAKCIYDYHGKIERVVGASWDITDNVLRAKELESSQKLLRQIIDSTPDWIFAKDKNHRYVLANKSFANAVSLKPEEIVGKIDLKFENPDKVVRESRDNSKKQFWVDDDHVVASGETLIIPDDPVIIKGRKLHLHTVKTPLRNERDEIYGVLGYCRDLTQMREKDQLLADQQAKLLAASKMSSLGEMAGGIAHEINTPLAIIVNYAANVKLKIRKGIYTPEKICESLNIIEETGYRIGKIVKGLKSFSRNSDTDPMEEIKFSQIVDDTLSLCLERFKNHSIDFRVKIADPLIQCRATEISQVLMNLINNAHDAVENLADKWVSLEAAISERNTLVISVTDSGSGIPALIVEKMMNPFFTTKEIGKGTGLGLSISKGIIDSHKGIFSYDNASSNTRFVIEIPLQSA